MNNDRAGALLQWVNSVTGSDVQNLRELSNPTNVDIFVNVLRLIDKDNNCNVIPNDGRSQDKISYIVNYLEGIYHCTDSIVSSKHVTEGNELEIGKLISLLLCGAVQGNNVPYFIERIHQLENKIQYHLKAIIEAILYSMEKGALNGKSLNRLLQETDLTWKEGQPFHNSPGPVFSPCIPNSPAEIVYSNSPFMTLMLSPQMKNKQNQFMTNKLHQKVKKLEMDLSTQQHIQTTLEDELAERNQEIDAKGTQIRELQKELVQVKMVADELEDLQHVQNDFEKAERENNKLKQRIADLEHYKQQNASLEERTESFLKKKDSFEKKMEETQLIQARCERYRQQAHHFEFQASELQASLYRREAEMQTIIRERDEALNAASESTELWRSRKLPDPDTDDEEYERLDDSLMPMDPKASYQESRLIELEFQNERLKKQLASSIDPEHLQQIKDRLDDVERSKKSYEEKFVEAKSKILALEDNMAQIQDQSRIRQEALQRKIDDSDRMQSATKEKHEQTRKELSRVQSELTLSRGEVEAHVIAMEKQRVTTSKAMYDMAAERQACEEEAEQKLNKLRKELEVQEKQALENCDKMTKEYDTKLRHITDELQTIHNKAREEMQQKLADLSKQRDNFITEFSTKQEELQQLLQKSEKETTEVRDVYENMLAELKHELENEIQKNGEVTTAFNKTRELLQQNASRHEEEKHKLNEAISRVEENANQLMHENARSNKEIERLVQMSETLNENEDILKKELEERRVKEEGLDMEINQLSIEVTALKDSQSKLIQEKRSLEAEIVAAKENEALLLEEKALEISSLKLDYTTELESIIDKLMNENKASNLEMKKEFTRKVEEANEQISKLNEENEDKIKRIESMKEKNAKIEEDKEQQVKNLNEEMNKQVEASTEEIAKLKAKNEAKLNEFHEEMVKKDETFKQEIIHLNCEHEIKMKMLTDEIEEKDETSKQEFAQLKNESENKIEELKKEMNNLIEQTSKKDERSTEEIARLKAENEAKLNEFHEEMVKKDEIFKQEIIHLNCEHEIKMKMLTDEIEEKDETSKQEFTQLKNESENKVEELKKEMNNLIEQTSKKDETSQKEIANREKSLVELTQSFTKLKQEMDATEERLLDITRERNDLEKELAKESNVGREKIEALSFQKEQMKAEHSKVVQAMVAALQEERKNHKKEKKDMQDQLDKACHGLKVAADNIEEFKATIEELEHNVAIEKSRAKTSEVQLDKVRQDSKDKQKKIFEDAAKNNGAMEEAYEKDRSNWKRKLDAALEENMVLRSEMFENTQKYAGDMMESRRRVQETEDRASIEEKKLREEIRSFIGSLANERVTSNDLKEKLQQFVSKERELVQSLESREKVFNELKDKLEQSDNKERELLQSLEEKKKTILQKSEELQAKEKSRIDELYKLRSGFEAEKNMVKEQAVEQVQEKTKEAEKLQQKVEEFRNKLEQMSVDFDKEKEGTKTEFQKELQKQSSNQEEQVKEIENLQNQIKAMEDSKEKEAEETKVKVEEAKEELESEIKDLKMKLEESSSSVKNMQQSLESTMEERHKVVSEHEKSEETWKNTESELKNKLTQLEDECKVLREKEQSVVRDEEEVKTITALIEKLEQENLECEEQLQEERATNRRLGGQVNSLEAQLKHADSTIRERNQALQKIQNQSYDASRSRKQVLMDLEKVFPVEKLQDCLDENSSTDEEPMMTKDEIGSGSSTTSLSSTNSELTKSSTSLNTLTRSNLRQSTMSGRSAANRRQSAIYLKGNTPSVSGTTTSAAFFVCNKFATDPAEEPEVDYYDWERIAELDRDTVQNDDLERLAELERRNTICKPHMKTTYPIETQTRPDDNKTLISSMSDSGYRTGLQRKSEEAAGSRTGDPKLRKEQPNSKSEGHLKRSKSKRMVDKVTSKLNSLRSKSNENIAKDTDKQSGGSGNVAFSIDNTPPSKRSKDNSASKPAAKNKESTASNATKKQAMAFTINNPPPKTISSELKPKRQRTINRSTASTQLVLEKDREVYKEAKKKEYLRKTNRRPLRTANTKK